MSHRNQTLMFFAVSVLVFLFYVKFDREKKNDESAEFVTPEAISQHPFEQGKWPDQLVEHSNGDGSIIDKIKGQLESGIQEIVDEHLHKIWIASYNGSRKSRHMIRQIRNPKTR